jgi:ABC-type uncharacterized transport system substrate-binding protein
VHRILGGAKPGDMAVDRLSMFKRTLNLKTARAPTCCTARTAAAGS